jgi:hypothetical protein
MQSATGSQSQFESGSRTEFAFGSGAASGMVFESASDWMSAIGSKTVTPLATGSEIVFDSTSGLGFD